VADEPESAEWCSFGPFVRRCRKLPSEAVAVEDEHRLLSQVLDELRAAHALVAAKATPDEAQAYGAWLTASAQAAAEAAKDGGFMGFHAKRISDGEQAMLDQVRQAVTD